LASNGFPSGLGPALGLLLAFIPAFPATAQATEPLRQTVSSAIAARDAAFFGETFVVERNAYKAFEQRMPVRNRDAGEIADIKAAKATLTDLLHRLHSRDGRPTDALLTEPARAKFAGHVKYIRETVAAKPVLRYRITDYKLDREKGVLSLTLMLWHRVQGFDLPKGRTAHFERQADGRWLVGSLGHIEWP